jgi:hypothetical protein
MQVSCGQLTKSQIVLTIIRAQLAIGTSVILNCYFGRSKYVIVQTNQEVQNDHYYLNIQQK